MHDFRCIIVHGGKSHQDEIIATALAVAVKGETVPVYRRDPTPSELEDPNVLVLDVGMKMDVSKNNFDHHHLDRGASECSFSLLAKDICLDGEITFPWFSTWRVIDSLGPFAWAKNQGVDWEKASSLLSPILDLVSSWWEEASGDKPVDEVLVGRLLLMGNKILAHAERFRAFCERAEQYTPAEIGGVPVMDLTWASPEDALEFGDKYAKSKGVVGGIIVSRDNRGPGLTLYRREDDPRVDFSALDGRYGVVFAHKGGFIAKTSSKDVDWALLVRAAIKEA